MGENTNTPNTRHIVKIDGSRLNVVRAERGATQTYLTQVTQAR